MEMPASTAAEAEVEFVGCRVGDPMVERDGIPAGMRCVKASEFKTECLQLMDEVGATGEEIVVTDNGRPAAKLVPYRSEPVSWFGRDRGRIEIKGDIVSPVDVMWDAESGLGRGPDS